MASDRYATADVNTYECLPHFKGIARATATLRYGDGTEVRFSVPFTTTLPGETASMKYAREYGKILDALRARKAQPYGEHGWEVPYESGEALIGSETSASYSSVEEERRLSLEAFKIALEEVCSEPRRVKVSELYEAEWPVSSRT